MDIACLSTQANDFTPVPLAIEAFTSCLERRNITVYPNRICALLENIVRLSNGVIFEDEPQPQNHQHAQDPRTAHPGQDPHPDQAAGHFVDAKVEALFATLERWNIPADRVPAILGGLPVQVLGSGNLSVIIQTLLDLGIPQESWSTLLATPGAASAAAQNMLPTVLQVCIWCSMRQHY